MSIGNNVSISANVRFITHDVIQSMLQTMDNPDYPAGKNGFYMGKIEVLDNVVIGANATILYNTKIGPNALVAAGSVVVKDVPEGAEVLVSCKYFECYKYVLGSDAAEADHASDIEDNCYNTENIRNTGKVNISVDAMSFRSVIVIDGSGKIAVGNNTMDYKAGDSFFVTAGEKVINLEGTGTVIVTKV